MIQRIELILKTRNLSPTQFADTVGIQRPTMSHILARRNNPSLDFVMKVLNTFPEISSEWLLTGKGQMLKLGTTLPDQPASVAKNEQKNPEFEWDNENSAYPMQETRQQVLETSKPSVDSYPISAEPQPVPYPTASLNEKVSPVIDPRDLRQKSDIERIIVFFMDGTFKSYV